MDDERPISLKRKRLPSLQDVPARMAMTRLLCDAEEEATRLPEAAAASILAQSRGYCSRSDDDVAMEQNEAMDQADRVDSLLALRPSGFSAPSIQPRAERTSSLPTMSQLLAYQKAQEFPVVESRCFVVEAPQAYDYHYYQVQDRACELRNSLPSAAQCTPRDMEVPVLSRLSLSDCQSQSSSSSPAKSEPEEEPQDKTPWPSAIEYSRMFETCRHNGQDIPLYELGVDARGVPFHPDFIYSKPTSCVYFLRCSRLLGKGSFGFPRVRRCDPDDPVKTCTSTGGAGDKKPRNETKEFTWRKMSFVTGIPSKKPLVRYITASCYRRDVSDPKTLAQQKKNKVFRMHAVMLADESGTGEVGQLVLVHIRAGSIKRVGIRLAQE